MYYINNFMKKILILALCFTASLKAISQCSNTSSITISPTSTGANISWAAVSGAVQYSARIFSHPANVDMGVFTVQSGTSWSFVGLASGTQYRFQIATICSGSVSTGTSAIFTTTSSQIVYTPMSTAGYSFKYLKADSLFHLSVGDTTLKRADTRAGAIVFKTSDSLFYGYDGLRWKSLGGNITNLTNQINNKVDSIYNSIDTIFYKKNGVTYGFVMPIVQPTRTITTTSPLQGGGDLSANRTLSIDSANSARDGYLSRHDWGVFNNKLNTTGGTLTGALINSYTSTASTPASSLLGSWFNGGTSTTTKPHFLIEPTAATSTGWNANGTAFGVNAAPGFIGNLMDLHFNGTSQFRVALNAVVTSGQFTAGSTISATTSINSGGNYNLPNAYKLNWGGGNTFIEGADTYFRVQVNGVERWRILANGKTSQPTTANSPKGTATLVNGVVTINNTLATAGCFIQVNYLTGTALSTTSSILTVSSIVAATSFTVTAYNAGAATTNTSDNNTIEYTISN